MILPAPIRGHRALLLAALACVSFPALAQDASEDAEKKGDKSGTNPTTFNRSFNIGTDFRALLNGRWFNNATVRYTQPFNNNQMNIAVKVPVPSTNLLGGSATGVGDISAKWNWLAYLDRRQGLVISTELTAPTASRKVFGSGKWVVAPGISYAYFLSPEWIVAPALVHSVSFAGDEGRTRVNRTDFDFYTVYKPKGQNWWLTSDITVGYDYVAKTTPASWKLALGTTVGKIGDGVVNLSLRPGVGIGRDRPANWTMEVSLSVVGF
ncbi:MAG: hypothetical protein ACRDBH_02855 [Bosea sp. (in: a-proteobacteria)]